MNVLLTQTAFQILVLEQYVFHNVILLDATASMHQIVLQTFVFLISANHHAVQLILDFSPILVNAHKTLIALQIIVLLVRQCQLAFHLQTLLEVTVLIVLIVH